MSGKLNDSTDYGAFTYKKFTETFFKIEVISDCRYIVKDTDVKTDKEIVHRYQTQEDAWNAAMLCANRQTFDLSVKIPGSVHMSVNYKEQTISVIGSDNEYSNAIVHAFQKFKAPFSGKIVHIFPEQSAVI